MEITKEQKERILVLDPNFFKVELEIGKWYRLKDECIYWLMNYQGKRSECYGFNTAKYYGTFYTMDNSSNWILATDQEVEDALIIEAKRRGYKKGATISRTQKMLDKHGASMASKVTLIINNNYFYNNSLVIDGRVIFIDGIWAKIIETITKSEAEKLLNKIII